MSGSDKKVGVVGLTLFDLRRRSKVGKLSMESFCPIRIAFWVARHCCGSNPLLILVARLSQHPIRDVLTPKLLRYGGNLGEEVSCNS